MHKFSEDPLYELFKKPTLVLKTKNSYSLALEDKKIPENEKPVVRIHRKNDWDKDVSLEFLSSCGTVAAAQEMWADGIFSNPFGEVINACSYMAQLSYQFPALKDLLLSQQPDKNTRIVPKWFKNGEGISPLATQKQYPIWFSPTADPTNPYTPYLKYVNALKKSPGSRYYHTVGEWQIFLVGSRNNTTPIASCRWDDREGLQQLLDRMSENNWEMNATEVALLNPREMKNITQTQLWTRAKEKVGERIFPVANRANINAAEKILNRAEDNLVRRIDRSVVSYPSVAISKGREVPLALTTFGSTTMHTRDEITKAYDSAMKTKAEKRLNLLRIDYMEQERVKDIDFLFIGNVDIALSAIVILEGSYRTSSNGYQPRVDEDGKALSSPCENMVFYVRDYQNQTWEQVEPPKLETLV